MADGGTLSTSTRLDLAGATRIPLWLWGAALLPMLVLFLWHWSYPPPVTTTDYAQYLMQAHEVLRGRPFATTNYIFTDLNPMHGPPAYPPGFPMTLAPVIAVFGEGPAVLKLLMLASALAFLLFVGRYFVEREGVAMAAAIVMFTGVALEASLAMQAAMSDLGFCALSWAIILLADGKDRWSWGRTLLLTVLGFAAIGYRAAGVVLVPAVVLFAVLHWRRHGARALVPAASWLLALVLASVILQRNAASALAGVPTPGRLARHAMDYRFGVFNGLLYPFSSNVANDAYHGIALLLVLIGAAVWLWNREKRYSFLAIYTFGTMGMLVMVWAKADRYLWPLFPVLAYTLLLGIRASVRVVARAWTLERRTRVAAAVVAVLALAATATDMAQPRPVGFLEFPDVQALFARVSALRDAEGTEPRLLFANPRVLAWQTNVPAMGLFAGDPVEVALDELRRKRITHVIFGDAGLSRSGTAMLRELMTAEPQRFDLIYSNPTFSLYRFDGS